MQGHQHWTVITVTTGQAVGLQGKPLYFWKDDKKAGDADGDGRSVWHIAAP
jgi:predicted lipoprotein with Yx(FWY)xxD motif